MVPGAEGLQVVELVVVSGVDVVDVGCSVPTALSVALSCFASSGCAAEDDGAQGLPVVGESFGSVAGVPGHRLLIQSSRLLT